MNSSPQAHVGDYVSQAEPLGVILPIELHLDILQATIVQNRKDRLPWCLSLSLVCRAVRAVVLPIVYDVLFLGTNNKARRAYTGWNGKQYKHAGLAFLSWILHDSSAPPRRHIKHLMFLHQGELRRNELVWSRAPAKADPAEWPIERLTVEHAKFSDHLHLAGLRAQRVFQIGPHQHMRCWFGDGLFQSLSTSLWMVLHRTAHVQFWPREESPDGPSDDRLGMDYITCQEITPIPVDMIPASATKTLTVTIQLVEGDYLQQYPDLLPTGIAAFMHNVPEGLVILACSADYRIAGQPVENFIRAAVPTVLSADAVESRVRVSHSGWTPLSGYRQFRALAREMRSGRDPFDGGHGLTIDSK